MLQIDVFTIFPAIVEAGASVGIVQRANESGLVSVRAHDLRRWSGNRHRTVDDAPFGGGPGMVMRAEPFFLGVESVRSGAAAPDGPIVLLSPRGERFDSARARRYASGTGLILLCGRYEGIDERVRTHLATDEVSLGDFVLTGGEVAALAVIEAVTRLLPGALGDAQSAAQDSFEDGLLDHPHYTRPAEFRGLTVPSVLLSGNHGAIAEWRRNERQRATLERRPDLRERSAQSGAKR
jgi:tRNA (guanine37-N1)-methyltransferase